MCLSVTLELLTMLSKFLLICEKTTTENDTIISGRYQQHISFISIMFSLTTDSTTFIWCQTYCERPHSERKPLLPLHGLLFLINSKGSFYAHPTDRMVHTTAFVIPFVEQRLERERVQWVQSIQWPITLWEDFYNRACKKNNNHINYILKSMKTKRTLFNDTRQYKFSIKVSSSSKGQNKSKLQKQISDILISTVTAAWYNYRNGVRRWWSNYIYFHITY